MAGIGAHTQREMLAGVVMKVLLEPESEGSLQFLLIELKEKKSFKFLQP